jgi:hypothetical protein
MSDENSSKKVRYSSKALSIHQLDALIKHFKELDNKNDFQILIMTPYGFIKGDLEAISDGETKFVTENQDNPGTFKVDLSHLLKMRNEHLVKLEDDEKIVIVDNGATLNFRNVEIYKDDFVDPIVNLEQMLVFADQIISFSIVPRQR